MLHERSADHVTWLTFDRPDQLNAFRVVDYRELRLALERATTEPDTHVVVLTGHGRAFSVGADRSLLVGEPDDQDVGLDAGEEFSVLLEVLDRCDKPVIAAVNGLSVGFGCTILLHCDLAVAAESARFRLPFTAMGIVPEAGSSVLLPTRVRRDDATWTLLSSEWIEAPAAQEMGLVWRVAPDADLVDRVGEVAATLAALDPRAVAATKRLLVAGRVDAVRSATERELVEMKALFGSAPTWPPRDRA